MWGDNTFEMNDAGGFVNGDTTDSPSGAKKETVRRVQSVIPLVARQINECEDEDFSLFGTQVQIVTVMGILRDFDVQSTKATCTIEDFSGCIKAILWLEAENDSVTAIPPVKEGCYVQVFGSLRNQDGEKMIMILKMVPIDDCDAIVNHLLQVVHVRLATERMEAEEDGQMTMGASTSAMSMTDLGNANGNASSMGLSRIQEQVFRILQPVTDCVGVSRDTIMKSFQPNQAKEVKAALEFLLNEGHAYTTIDNDHFKATD